MVVKGTVLQDLTTFLQALHTRRVNCNLATVSPPSEGSEGDSPRGTSLYRTASRVPMVSSIERFHCSLWLAMFVHM